MNQRNPFLKAERDIIKKVYRNTAVINLNVKNKAYNSDTGAITELTATFKRNVYISNPHTVSEAVADKTNYMTGDLTADIAYLTLQEMFTPFVEDEELISDFRTFSGRNGGLDTATDTVEFYGTTYRIVSITPKTFFAGVPTKFKLQLRVL